MSETWRLADGVMLSLAFDKSALVDVGSKRPDVEIGPELESQLDHAARGRLTLSPELASLAEQGWLARGGAFADPIFAARLRELDACFFDTYARALTPRVRAAYEAVLVAHAYRKRFVGRLGQAPVLPETALRRALHVGDARVVGKKRVVCVGDDDLVSVALAALGHDVTSVDVDDFLLELVGNAAPALGLEIARVRYDATTALPAGLGGFDVAVTDPMSNRPCFELFLSRALALLNEGGTLYSAVFPPNARLFYAICSELGVSVRAHHKKHNRYYSAGLERYAYESDWVVLEKQAGTRLAVAPDQVVDGEALYRDDFSRRATVQLIGIDAIDLRFAGRQYAETLLDVLEKDGRLELGERAFAEGDDWFAVSSAVRPWGLLTLAVHTKRREVTLTLEPHAPASLDALRELLLKAYKRRIERVETRSGRTVWELRVV